MDRCEDSAWIDVRTLFEQGTALNEKGGFTFDSQGEGAQMEVEEDCQDCVRRS